MTDLLAKELRAVMEDFFSNATDQEFWSAVEEADAQTYSNVKVQVLDWHRLFELTRHFDVDLEDVVCYSMPVEAFVKMPEADHAAGMDILYSEEPVTESATPLSELPTAA